MNALKYFFLLLTIPLILHGQLDHTAKFSQTHPDFGETLGTWGQVQYYRPYGLSGIILDDWRDLMIIHPLTGEPINTDRAGWLFHEPVTSLWEQSYPILVSPADTVAPSLLVNYKQGDYVFKDFNLWYHTALAPHLRMGWSTKFRSQNRVFNISEYNEQQHQLQFVADLNESRLRLQTGYRQRVIPFYAFLPDTSSGVYLISDSVQFSSERWEGLLDWDGQDTLGLGSRLFAQLKMGDWSWYRDYGKSIRSLGFVQHRRSLFGSLIMTGEVGIQTDQLDTLQFSRVIGKVGIDQIQLGPLSGELGLKTSPQVDLEGSVGLQAGRFGLGLDRKIASYDHLLKDVHESGAVNRLFSNLDLGPADLHGQVWRGKVGNSESQGLELGLGWQLPWDLNGSLRYSMTNSDSSTWLMTNQQVRWELRYETPLLDDALLVDLKLWGRHLLDHKVGNLDLDGFYPIPASASPSISIHQLNYTVHIQVSSLILGFTDINVLQDPLWNSNFNASWNPEYSLGSNILPESRLRYLSLIWVFHN